MVCFSTLKMRLNVITVPAATLIMPGSIQTFVQDSPGHLNAAEESVSEASASSRQVN